jgi:hypothetical protein
MLSTEQLAVQLRAGLPQPRNEHWESLSISVQMRDGASLSEFRCFFEYDSYHF